MQRDAHTWRNLCVCVCARVCVLPRFQHNDRALRGRVHVRAFGWAHLLYVDLCTCFM
jgi:hypothetical protein